MHDSQYKVVEITRNEIFVDYSFNSRGQVFPYQVADLVDSLEQGPLQSPVSVEPYNDPNGKFKYRLLSGFRREKAFDVLKRPTIPAFVITGLNEEGAREHNIIENLARKDLDRVQEAKALKYFFDRNWSDYMVAEKFGKSRQWVEERRIILDMPDDIQKLVAVGLMSGQQIVTFKRMPLAQQYEMVRTLKDGKFRLETLGTKVKKYEKRTVIQKRYLTNEKPTESDIENLKMAIYSGPGPSLVTEVLGWVQGFSTTKKIWERVIQECDREGHTIEVPEDIKLVLNS